jgi:predicted RNase H-like HicB family nuclease
MIDSTRPGAVLADTVLDALRTRGFACTVVGDHVIVTRDATRLVVPAPGRVVPETFARWLEHALRPVLGPDWLRVAPTGEEQVSGATDLDVQVLDAIVDQCPASGDWCAFLPAELTVMGTGATRDAALRDLKVAAALWLDLPVELVVLMTPDVI